MLKTNAQRWVVIALLLCLISSLGASIFQTNFGKVEYHDVTFVTESGHELDALLLVPENATAKTKAPAPKEISGAAPGINASVEIPISSAAG